MRLAEDVRRGALGGANITLPHKAAAAALADQLEPEARALGVANTWYAREGALWAANTDVHGARMTVARVPLDAASRVAVFGAGGAAPAALLVLDDSDRDGLLVNRSLSRAEALLSRLKPTSRGAGGRARGGRGRSTRTSSSTRRHWHTRHRRSLLLPGLRAVRGASAVSLSYGAGTRPFFESCAAGASALDGLTMLLHQGAASFERGGAARRLWWRCERRSRAPLVCHTTRSAESRVRRTRRRRSPARSPTGPSAPHPREESPGELTLEVEGHGRFEARSQPCAYTVIVERVAGEPVECVRGHAEDAYSTHMMGRTTSTGNATRAPAAISTVCNPRV